MKADRVLTARDLDRAGVRDWRNRLARARRLDSDNHVRFDTAWNEIKREYEQATSALPAADVPELEAPA